MKNSRSLIAITLSLVLLSGCSVFGENNDIEPAKLEKIDAQVELTPVWSAKSAASNKSYWMPLQLAVNDQSVFTADHSGVVVALEVDTGRQQWSVDLDLPISGGLGYGDKKVVLGTIEGQVYTLNAQDGSVLWSSSVSSEFSQPRRLIAI
jgi:outer membrane protein assembly factor BamB